MTSLAAALILGLFPALTPARSAEPAEAESVPSLDYLVEPLVITAPRVRIKDPLAIDPQINSTLRRLLESRSEKRPGAEAALDNSLQNLVKLTTLEGYKLQARYTELGFLLTEGLAGVQDYSLQSSLDRVARSGANPQTRAAALVALGYTKNREFLALVQDSMRDQNVTVRLGALEALLQFTEKIDPGRADSPERLMPEAQLQVSAASRDDRSIPVRILAAAASWRNGDHSGREILREFMFHQDWFVRAMAARYIGELGDGFDYTRLFGQLGTEKNELVAAEVCQALLRLEDKRDAP